ncbi:MAG: hypothetical protein M3Q69_14415, partial [Acidobacteriota bacterium]|nr:hypothetical protein [Acidobacteriota bacterium]
ALAGTFALLAQLSAVARLATYLFTAASVPVLRRKLGDSGGFRLPGGWVIPILGVIWSLVIVATLDKLKLMMAAGAVLLGAVIYVLATFGVRQRKLPL